VATTRSTTPRHLGGRTAVADGAVEILLRLIAVAGLATDVWVHAALASDYSHVGDTLSQGRLFVAEAVIAGAVGLWLLVTGSRLAWLAAFIVGAGGVALVVLYRYVDVGALGPIPNMYDPIWFFRKTLSAYAEGATAVAAVIRLALIRR
jgi:hypothetical protein